MYIKKVIGKQFFLDYYMHIPIILNIYSLDLVASTYTYYRHLPLLVLLVRFDNFLSHWYR